MNATESDDDHAARTGPPRKRPWRSATESTAAETATDQSRMNWTGPTRQALTASAPSSERHPPDELLTGDIKAAEGLLLDEDQKTALARLLATGDGGGGTAPTEPANENRKIN